MKPKRIWDLMVVVVLCGSATISSQSQTATKGVTDDVLSRQVEASDTEDIPTKSAFIKAMSTARAPGGIVRVHNCEPDPIIQRWRPLTTSLRNVLDTIVFADPQYRWQIDQGVINLTLKSNEPALLNVRINKLEVKDARSTGALVDNLLALPEVQQARTKLKLQSALRISVGPVSLKPNRTVFSISCEGVSVKEALNRIVRNHGSAVWEYRERRCGGKVEFDIKIIVE